VVSVPLVNQQGKRSYFKRGSLITTCLFISKVDGSFETKIQSRPTRFGSSGSETPFKTTEGVHSIYEYERYIFSILEPRIFTLQLNVGKSCASLFPMSLD
jgi:hypothetical protein